LRRYPNRIRETPLTILEIYETNNSNQSQRELKVSVNRLRLSAEGGRTERRRSINREADRFSQTKQRLHRHRNGPRFCRGIFSVHGDRGLVGLANRFEHRGRGPTDLELSGNVLRPTRRHYNSVSGTKIKRFSCRIRQGTSCFKADEIGIRIPQTPQFSPVKRCIFRRRSGSP
jgi:hypothetical protein